MASLYITEFSGQQGGIPVAQALAQQKLTIGAVALPSAALNSNTRVVRLHTDAICSVAVNEVATADMYRMAAGQTDYLHVPAGSVLSVITNS